jgi:predicted metalloprotease
VLERNPVYTVSVRPSCPPQREPADEAAYQAQVRALVACLDEAWARALLPTEVGFSAPSVAFYGESLLTVCGLLGVEFPAMYCPLDSTLYFSAESWRESSYYRLATAELAFHEYAHHVQRLAGVYDVLLAASDTVRGLQRRVELQALCLAMYELASSDIGLSATDVSDLEYQFAWPGDVEGHGSTRAKTRWGRRGLGARTAGACNTWTATGDEVR